MLTADCVRELDKGLEGKEGSGELCVNSRLC